MKAQNLLLAALALLGSGCVNREAQQQAKETAKIINDPATDVVAQPVATRTIQETVLVTGSVTTSNDTNVSPRTGGKVVSVLVRDGDRVTAGQTIAQLDTSILNAQVAQALAQEFQAQATLGQARSALNQALTNQVLNPAKSAAAVRSAQAGLRSAQAALQKSKTGARPQERLQAQATLASAKANLDTQTKQLDRIRTLVQEGASAGSQLDTQQATYEAARTTYQNAQQALSLVQEGNRAEDVAAAEEAVRSARESVATAQANQKLDSLYADQVANAKAQVASASAGIAAAHAGVVQARQNLADATVRAPFSGTISGRPVQAGTVLAAGGTIARIVGSQGIYFDGDISSDVINDLQVGQSATIAVDAVPGRTFPGTVKSVGNLGSSVGRLFSARVAFDGVPADVRPGMFARGTIVLRTVPNATVVPTAAILKDAEGKPYVMLAQGGVAKRAAVQTGLAQGDVTQVGGLPTGAQVIVKGQSSLLDGAKVKQVQG